MIPREKSALRFRGWAQQLLRWARRRKDIRANDGGDFVYLHIDLLIILSKNKI
jgi:hypothetical protein